MDHVTGPAAAGAQGKGAFTFVVAVEQARPA
jgi:hypothetical protein